MTNDSSSIGKKIYMTMKKCYRCWEEFDLSMFPRRKGKPMGVCTTCYATHYGNPDKVEEKRIELEKQSYKRKVELHNNLLIETMKCGCMDCGEKDVVVLEFDHRDPKEKSGDISSLRFGSTKQLKEELAKCDVVCANCHRKRTAKMFGSWRNLLLEEN